MPADQKRYQFGVDIGGTFTDLVIFDSKTGQITIGKTLTTPSDPSLAVQNGIKQLLEATGVAAKDVSNVLHATTLATNALIERKGAQTALLTTEGFRDAVEIRDEGRYDLFDLFLEMPEPLVPRRLRLGVRERMLADGSVDRPLDVADAKRSIESLKAQGIQAVAISLLHSYMNPAHERALRQLVEEVMPGAKVSVSSEVVPEIREYPRTSTTIANVYVQGIMERYLGELLQRLRRLGLNGELFIMLSSGGICTADTAARFPVRLIESGPAAGALVATFYGALTGRTDLLAFDMGGTTAKACLIEDGRPYRTSQFEVARVWRFKKGSGLPIKAPVIELIEIGAGGGSIASVDHLGLLRIGPESAGADPGPVCYRQGGTEPTVTDADLVLGYLDPDFFLGGKMKLDRDGAVAAIERVVGKPLGLDAVHAAWGMHQVVNESMASAARAAAVERGKDPRRYPVFAFGGAGPVHAYRVGRILRSPEVIVPLGAGVASAMGLLCAPLAFDYVHSWVSRLDKVDWDKVQALYDEMADSGREILKAANVAEADVQIERSADMRYVGQGYETNVRLPAGPLDASHASALFEAFIQTYAQLYGRALTGVPVEIVNLRCVVSGPTPKLARLETAQAEGRSADAAAALKGRRAAYFPEPDAFVQTPVYDRYRLGPGAVFPGPAIIEERESTTVVGPDATVRVDDVLNLVLEYKHD